MSSVNVGALDLKGHRIPTKSALRRAVKYTPHSVYFDQTGLFQEANLPSNIEVADLIALNKNKVTELSVVGPDPYRKRQWYATVSVNNKGEVNVT